MASEFGVVAYVSPPTLEGVTQPDLIKFETEYTTYKEKLGNMNEGRDDDNKLPVATIRDCMEGPTLQALCIMGKIPGASTLEQATASKVETWFEAAHTAAPTDLSERIHSAVSSVRYKHCKQDPAGAALTFCVDAIKALDKNNASEILKDEGKAKFFIDKLEEKLEPNVLRERVRMKRTTWSKADKGNPTLFQECASALAVDVAQNEIARSRVGNAAASSRKRDNSERGERPGSRKGTGKTQDKGGEPFEQGKPTKKQKRDKKKSQTWTAKCLNPECDEKHKVADCEKTSDEKKKTLLDEYYEKQICFSTSRSKRVKAATCRDSDTRQNPGEGRYKILIEESVEAIALGDYGADLSVIPAKIFEQAKHADATVTFKKLPQPLRIELACKSMHVEVYRSTTLTITLNIPGSNIPVRFRGIEFYIADFETDEVLLGRPFLNSIGFDLDKHLEKLGAASSDEREGSATIAAVRYAGLSYQDTQDDPIELPETMAAGIGEDSRAAISAAFERIITEAQDNGISATGKDRLRGMLMKHRNEFRIKLGPDEPAKVEPLTIQLAPGSRPFKTPQRRYAPLQTAFINSTIQDLERVGAVRRNPSAKWASPALAVPKLGSSNLRFTVDLRAVNSRTVPVQSAMPHFESKLQEISGSSKFAKLDLAHGYWQIPLAEPSQEVMSIQTPLGVYTPSRLLQGGSDSGNHFQAVLQHKFATVPKLCQWIDDFLLHAATESELLDNIEKFLECCQAINLKIHAGKTTLFCTEATFCGRVITEEGISHHPRHFESLLNMNKPTFAEELQQLLCATNWMRTSLPAYSELVAPLHDLLEAAYRRAGKRTKAAVRKISLADSWGPAHDDAFSKIKTQLAASIKLAHVKENHALCLFTDASETHWASILTQVPNEHRKKDVENQGHEPLCFLSGAFRNASSNWSVPEKEGFAIVESMTRLDHIVMGREVNIFTDHANLVYLYDPYGRNPGMPRHTASKLLRWAMKLSAYRYVVEHLAGERNVWADMMTRWSVKPHSEVRARPVAAKSILLAPVNPGVDERYDLPSESDIRKAQDAEAGNRPRSCQESDGLWKTHAGMIWIPDADKMMKLRILIGAHAGIGGHRGQAVTMANIQAKFSWKNMREDVKSFVSSCLHCLCAKSPSEIPRPLGHAMHADRPNKLLHFDYLYMTPSQGKFLYVLILKDDHSGYVWLVPTRAADSETTATALINWFTTFGVVTEWVSDRGSHFKNELVAQLKEKLRVSHHFTLAYCPWSNGTVEVVCREVLRTCRALLSELQLSQKCWPDVLPMIQSALNNSVLSRLGNRCPQTVFTGLPQSNPISTILRRQDGVLKVRTIDEVRVRQRMQIPQVQEALDNMHKHVSEKASALRQRAVNAHNQKVGVRPINFGEGDYVLRGVMERERVKKPALRWKGPYRVVRCLSDYIFVVEDLLTGSKEQVHGRRLKFFTNASFEVTEEVKEHLDYQQGELLTVDRIDDIRRHKGDAELLVSWKGFGPEETDWVKLESMKEDVPVLVSEALEHFLESGTARQRTVVESL